VSRARRVAAAAVALAAVLTMTGCGVGMPASGPVVPTDTSGSGVQDNAVNINPRRPGRDATPREIVRGFLEAMTATPAIKTTVARQFLTDEAAATWQPTETIIYAAVTAPRGSNSDVETTLIDAHRTDQRGAWLGPVSDLESTLRFPMVQEDDEWRIAEAPNALVVPQSWFEQRFRQTSLYFFDESGSILVPDPVFAPRGKQFASTLVNGLLTGPPPELATHQLNFLPAGLRSLVSVPVSAAGVAHVDLKSDSDDESMPAPDDAELLVSQLAWTLRQDPSIERFRVTIGGRPVQLADQSTEFGVDHGNQYAPYVTGSSSQLFGLRGGQVIGGTADDLDPVSGPFGQPGAFGLRTIAAELRATRVGAVSSDGTTLYVGPLRESSDPVVPMITTGEDLLEPAWDFSGRLWSVDRRSSGSVVQYVQGDTVRTLDVPGISGADVKDFLISRDGTRFVAVLRRDAATDSIVVSRILTNGEGRVVQALPAEDVIEPGDLSGRIRDVAWRSPTTIVVLQPVSRQRFQVRTAAVDGAPPGLDAISVTVSQDVVELIGSPVPGKSAYAFTRTGLLVDLSGSRGEMTPIDPDVTSLGYAG
jgi:hypothetical protein